MSPAQQAYTDLVAEMQLLGNALIAATSVQFESPPHARKIKESVSESKGIRNPTLDTVLDPRRMQVSDEIARAAAALRSARSVLSAHTESLHGAVARWEGQEGTTPA